MATAFAQWFVVDRQLGPLAALAASWASTRGCRLEVAGLAFGSVSLACVISFATLGLGLPFALGLLALVWAVAYERLSARLAGSPAPSGEPARHYPPPPLAPGLRLLAGLACVPALAMWDGVTLGWLPGALERAWPQLAPWTLVSALGALLFVPLATLLAVALLEHRRHRRVALDARGVWLDASPTWAGRHVPWDAVRGYDLVPDGVALALGPGWAPRWWGPVLAVPEEARAELVEWLGAHGVGRLEA